MDQIDSMKIKNKDYIISASPNSTNSFTSGDDGVGNSWTNIDQMVNTDNNGTIFNKISTMFKNIRYLYRSLGTGISPSNTATEQLADKAPTKHGHTIDDIPHTNQATYSESDKVPTMDLINQIYNTVTKLDKRISELEKNPPKPIDEWEPFSLSFVHPNLQVTAMINRKNRIVKIDGSVKNDISFSPGSISMRLIGISNSGPSSKNDLVVTDYFDTKDDSDSFTEGGLVGPQTTSWWSKVDSMYIDSTTIIATAHRGASGGTRYPTVLNPKIKAGKFKQPIQWSY